MIFLSAFFADMPYDIMPVKNIPNLFECDIYDPWTL